ncbi:neutral zinc metallopeptidase [Nocardiopsis sediminis]|uniref:Neutral zinc metallopeptidase n=1 Tax=Nocardiopsis sediminis TaxID=1778267 RepID=A0ABV8FS26_9ACTN
MAVGTSSFAALVALLVSVALVANSASATPPSAQGGASDVTEFHSRELYERPKSIDLDIAAHPAYDMPVPDTVSCGLPDLDPESEASWRAFSDEIGVCLNDLWQPRLDELGLRTPAPTFHVTEDNPDVGSTEEGMTLAYYEYDSLSITVVLPNVIELSRDVPDDSQEAVWTALLGHEYGHHVQQATGILDASYEMERLAPNENEELEALRRTELQAECMGGIAMRGFGEFDAAEIDLVNEYLNGGSDLPTHGTARNRQYWFDQGTEEATLEACNTYDAPASDVR